MAFDHSILFPALSDLPNLPYMDMFDADFDSIALRGVTELSKLYTDLIRRTPGFEDVPMEAVDHFALRLAYGAQSFYEAGTQAGTDAQTAYTEAVAKGTELAVDKSADDAFSWAPLPSLEDSSQTNTANRR